MLKQTPRTSFTLKRFFVADHFHDMPDFQEERHGHNWMLEATVSVTNNETEMQLSQALDSWLKEVDYSLLNQRPFMACKNPTAEALAEWLFSYLVNQGFQGVVARLREKQHYWASCREATPRKTHQGLEKDF